MQQTEPGEVSEKTGLRSTNKSEDEQGMLGETLPCQEKQMKWPIQTVSER